jgi:hypothetical protein
MHVAPETEIGMIGKRRVRFWITRQVIEKLDVVVRGKAKSLPASLIPQHFMLALRVAGLDGDRVVTFRQQNVTGKRCTVSLRFYSVHRDRRRFRRFTPNRNLQALIRFRSIMPIEHIAVSRKCDIELFVLSHASFLCLGKECNSSTIFIAI